MDLYTLCWYEGDEALVSCGIMESLIRVINWYDNDDGQDHITVCSWTSCILIFHFPETVLMRETVMQCIFVTWKSVRWHWSWSAQYSSDINFLLTSLLFIVWLKCLAEINSSLGRMKVVEMMSRSQGVLVCCFSVQYVTRAVRVVDLITNLDMQAFQQYGGMTAFINRLQVGCAYEQSRYVYYE